MFGSKLRSWMENHIVRPRKKGNKNKSGNNSNSNFGILTAQNGHAKGASSAKGGTTTIGSPARRSEVSPIQNHTTSRRGWQSPNQDQLPSLSPRSDDLRQYQYQQQQHQQQYHHHYQVHQQQQQLQNPTPIYGNGTLPSGSGGQQQQQYKLSSNGYIPAQTQQGMSSSPRSITRDGFRTQEGGGNYSKSVDSGNFSTAMYGIKEEGYRKSSGGGGSGVISSSGNVMVNSLNYSTATSSSNELLEDLQHIEANRLKRGQHAKISSSSSSSINSNNNFVNNNSIIGNNGGLYMNNNGFEQPQSRVVSKMAPIVKHQHQVVQPAQQHYGSGSCGAYYEQHNSINNNLVYGKHPSVPPPPVPAKSHAVTQLSKNGNRPNNSSNNNNNNNNNGFEICTVTSGGGGKSGQTSTGSTLSTFANKFHKLTANRNNSFDGKLNHVNNNNNSNAVHHHQPPQPNGHHHHHHLHHHPQTTVVGAAQPGQPGGHHNTTLSSPESAYSTGYSSTDGTSPGGCSYTPEYYINIRTGTHYFPKGLTGCSGTAGSGGAGTGSGIGGGAGFENGNKFKCGLNRIEERHVEFAVEEQCPSPRKSSSSDLTASQTKVISSHGATTGGKGQSSAGTTTILKNGPSNNSNHNNNACLSQQQQQIQQQTLPNAVAMSPVMQKNLGMQHYRSIESPSPRQRCRIRTNPWLSTLDGSLAGTNLKKTEQDSGSTTSSGIKSSSGTDDNKKDSKSANALSDSDSSSSTEKVISKKMLTPRSVKKGCGDISRLDSKATTYCSNPLDSDEDATLNEMMGKFDESYHYEKETDILSCSDSDPTDCPSDIDTGQDAGDECDTDDLLDLDFIDTGSVVEVTDKEPYRHTGSCSYHNFPERRSSSRHRSGRCKRNSESGGSKRRKKLVRTRKKLAEGASPGSPGGLAGGRGCRSLGGTPVSLRRNQSEERNRERNAPLANRCNSLTFTEVHSLHSRILAISESEKALLKADLEADVKYKQLIHEAESILFSMKTNSMKELKEIKEPPTTICSPRRICNPPANKRVEMLRNCEADLKRELAKTCSQKCAESELNPVEGVIINKRLEVLRYETSISAPNSPKNTRMIPRKTHITNFINQNHYTEVIHRNTENDLKSAKLSPQPHPAMYERNIPQPKSPTITRRRFRSQSPKLNIESDSDSDELSRNLDRNSHSKSKSQKENISTAATSRKSITGKQLNNFRHTIHGGGGGSGIGEDKPSSTAVVYSSSFNEGDVKQQQRLMHKSPLMSFRSVDMGNTLTDDSYCPQSEPLKRKIYTCSATFEKIQRSLDVDPELSKKALLHKITLLRRERLAKSKLENALQPGLEPPPQSVTTCNGADSEQHNGGKTSELSLLNGDSSDFKQQLIMSTLADIKRSLEDQSVELNELNDSDN